MDLREKADALKEYAELENTEIGEFWTALISAAYRTDYASEDFIGELDKELDKQLDFVKTNARIVEREELFKRKVIDLEWL